MSFESLVSQQHNQIYEISWPSYLTQFQTALAFVNHTSNAVHLGILDIRFRNYKPKKEFKTNHAPTCLTQPRSDPNLLLLGLTQGSIDLWSISPLKHIQNVAAFPTSISQIL